MLVDSTHRRTCYVHPLALSFSLFSLYDSPINVNNNTDFPRILELTATNKFASFFANVPHPVTVLPNPIHPYRLGAFEFPTSLPSIMSAALCALRAAVPHGLQLGRGWGTRGGRRWPASSVDAGMPVIFRRHRGDYASETVLTVDEVSNLHDLSI